jgi:hypothetical protein
MVDPNVHGLGLPSAGKAGSSASLEALTSMDEPVSIRVLAK